MTELSEISQRVVAELEEQGWDNVYSLLNTVVEPTGDLNELSLFRQALDQIVREKLGIITMEHFFPRDPQPLTTPQSLELIAALEDWFMYDLEDPHWTLKVGDILKTRLPILNLTPQGLKQSEAILHRRGYQWWRPRKT